MDSNPQPPRQSRAERRRLLHNNGRLIVAEGGPRVEAKQKFHGDPPPQVPGKHEWIMIASFRTADPISTQFLLDLENLISINGPGCLWCEEPYSALLAARWCDAK